MKKTDVTGKPVAAKPKRARPAAAKPGASRPPSAKPATAARRPTGATPPPSARRKPAIAKGPATAKAPSAKPTAARKPARRKGAAAGAAPDAAQQLVAVVVRALEDIKAQEIVTLDVRGLTDVTDYMVIASGTSSRHVRAIADSVVDAVRKSGRRAIGNEGKDSGDWILVDFNAALLHVMSPDARKHYALEKLWTAVPAP